MSKHSAKISEGLTYDDVLVIPAYSEILPHMVSTSTQFSKNITLNIPVVYHDMFNKDGSVKNYPSFTDEMAKKLKKFSIRLMMLIIER